MSSKRTHPRTESLVGIFAVNQDIKANGKGVFEASVCLALYIEYLYILGEI
jgi:hypothetical protein